MYDSYQTVRGSSNTTRYQREIFLINLTGIERLSGIHYGISIIKKAAPGAWFAFKIN